MKIFKPQQLIMWHFYRGTLYLFHMISALIPSSALSDFPKNFTLKQLEINYQIENDMDLNFENIDALPQFLPNLTKLRLSFKFVKWTGYLFWIINLINARWTIWLYWNNKNFNRLICSSALVTKILYAKLSVFITRASKRV